LILREKIFTLLEHTLIEPFSSKKVQEELTTDVEEIREKRI